MLIHSLRLLFSQRFFALAFPSILCAEENHVLGGGGGGESKMALVFLTKRDFVRNLIQFS